MRRPPKKQTEILMPAEWPAATQACQTDWAALRPNKRAPTMAAASVGEAVLKVSPLYTWRPSFPKI